MSRRQIRIPPMLSATINMGLSALDGALFKDLGKCPYCGGRPMPYDTKEKQYATLITNGEKRAVSVRVRRFICRDCGKLLYADEPFYPDTRVGSAVIDLALALSLKNSFSHAAAVMEALRIEINRGTVRNYALSDLPVGEISMMYGLPMPYSFINMIGRGISAAGINTEEILRASGYPSRYQAPPDGFGTARNYFLARSELKKSREKTGHTDAENRPDDEKT
ncbi:MAG TPA: transposase family protein [Methanocorpusculum sp.]|nr:transposase family protein [Candidatus Methanocorpusculum equi]MCQ2357794.1 transposase family protein [Methanocorpusculum sp.]HJJ33326.1 transposase family protein [Methanocorpusculum sp.]HJJ45272.1 transposase family protein [Methanocorpusculum sp.]